MTPMSSRGADNQVAHGTAEDQFGRPSPTKPPEQFDSAVGRRQHDQPPRSPGVLGRSQSAANDQPAQRMADEMQRFAAASGRPGAEMGAELGHQRIQGLVAGGVAPDFTIETGGPQRRRQTSQAAARAPQAGQQHDAQPFPLHSEGVAK